MLRASLRPEFLNRLDGVIDFHALGREHVLGILDIQLDRVQKRLDDRELTLQVGPEAKAWLAERGYDPDYGARPLKRLIQKTILEPLSRGILAGEFGPGTTVIAELDGEIAVRSDPAEPTLVVRAA